MKTALTAQLVDGVHVGWRQLEAFPRGFQGQVVQQLDEFPGRQCRRGVVDQLLLLRPLDFLDSGQECVKTAELLQQLRAGLQADARHARNVVGRISCQGKQIDDLVRPHAPVGQQGRFVDGFLLAQVEEPDMRADQLAGILVGSADGDVHPFARRAAHQGGDDVIGLRPLRFDDRHLKGFEGGFDHGQLQPQVRRHLFALGLVGGQQRFAKDWPGAVPGCGQIIRFVGLDQVDQVPNDSEDSVSRLAGRTGHGWYCVVNLVN